MSTDTILKCLEYSEIALLGATGVVGAFAVYAGYQVYRAAKLYEMTSRAMFEIRRMDLELKRKRIESQYHRNDETEFK